MPTALARMYINLARLNLLNHSIQEANKQARFETQMMNRSLCTNSVK